MLKITKDIDLCTFTRIIKDHDIFCIYIPEPVEHQHRVDKCINMWWTFDAELNCLPYLLKTENRQKNMNTKKKFYSKLAAAFIV